MGQFKDFIENIDKELLESSLGRVYQHTQDRNLGIISASRGELTSAENNKRHKELKDAIRKAGYGYIRVKGRYVEGHGKDARNVDEKGLLVVGKKGDDGGHLHKTLASLGKKYGQDSVLHKSYNDPNAYLHGTNDSFGHGKKMSVGKWHPNRASEFHSVMKGKKFTFENYVFMPEKSFFIREDKLF